MKKKVLLKAPILTQSGYGEHARFVFRSLKKLEDQLDIYIEPLEWGKTGWIWEDTKERKDIESYLRLVCKSYKIENIFSINWGINDISIDISTDYGYNKEVNGAVDCLMNPDNLSKVVSGGWNISPGRK